MPSWRKPATRLDDLFGVAHRNRLGDLDFQLRRRIILVLQHANDIADEERVANLAAGDIDRKDDVGPSRIRPPISLTA